MIKYNAGQYYYNGIRVRSANTAMDIRRPLQSHGRISVCRLISRAAIGKQ